MSPNGDPAEAEGAKGGGEGWVSASPEFPGGVFQRQQRAHGKGKHKM